MSNLDLSELEKSYLIEAFHSKDLQGDRHFNHRCQQHLEHRFGSPSYLTPSCTSALELACILGEFGSCDEILLPSFSFSSLANACVLRGATPIFVDIDDQTLNISPQSVRNSITSKTKAILPVHYAGVACPMEELIQIANQHNLIIIEDAAQAYGSYYKDRPLGTIGQLGAFSFHQTKNIGCGEGGAILVNDLKYKDRAEIIREKGTNRRNFLEGKVDKYSWIDVGSSYLISELNAAVLLAQLEREQEIRKKRLELYDLYSKELESIGLTYGFKISRPPDYASRHNAHIFFLILPNSSMRILLEKFLNQRKIPAYRHFVSLHDSDAGRRFGKSYASLAVTESISECLLRLPISSLMSHIDVDLIISSIWEFFKNGR